MSVCNGIEHKHRYTSARNIFDVKIINLSAIRNFQVICDMSNPYYVTEIMHRCVLPMLDFIIIGRLCNSC